MSNNNTRPLIVGQEVPVTPYPVKMKGEVIKGFGRGSKELGIPKANLPEALFEEICKCMEPGIYYGWAQNHNELQRLHQPSFSFNVNTFKASSSTTAERNVTSKQKIINNRVLNASKFQNRNDSQKTTRTAVASANATTATIRPLKLSVKRKSSTDL
ncbi:19272_t:CDS:2 [Entrophospora sp. SA101]|nr:19272_t:CDS:2 [Entrophospora sp. SA101]